MPERAVRMELEVAYQYKPETHPAKVKYDSIVINVEISHLEAARK
jgi:hypothetical protein